MKHRKLKHAIAIAVSKMPTSFLRVSLYRTLFGYRITNSSIGRNTVLIVDEATLTTCKIGPKNLFAGPIKVVVEEETLIGAGNIFRGGWWTADKIFESHGYKRFLHIGKKALITENHYFDASGSFTLGERSWVAGLASQFWTHGANATDRDISIGEDCYLGSGVKFAPGTSLGNHCIVSMGSVVTKKFTKDNALIGGVPAKTLKDNYDWRTRKSLNESSESQ